MESELLLLARAIDEKIKYIESKLEKPYLIGFHHNNVPIQEAEEIVDNLLKDIDAEIEEQKDIGTFLDEEIKDSKEANEQYTNFLSRSESQLQEFETFACNNIPGYKKFVPPEDSFSDDFEYDYIDNNHGEDMITEALASPVLIDDDIEEVDNCVPEVQPNENYSSQDKNDRQNLDGMLENGIDALKLNSSFDQNSLINGTDIFPNESQMDLVTSPITVDSDNFKVVAKKLDFDQLSTGPSEKKPFVCSTEKKSKTPVEIEREPTSLKQLAEDVENISEIQDIGSTAKSKLRQPTKPVRRILAERQLISQSKDDTVPRRDTLAGSKDLPTGLRDGYTRDTLGARTELLSRRDTLGARKELPTGLRDVFTRDTLSRQRDLPVEGSGFRRDTIGSHRDTLGGRKELPTGLRDGSERDTFNSNLPRGLRDGMHRDTLTGEVINSRRLSHYRAAPPKIRPLGTMPSSPKEPVLSELAMRIINKYKTNG